MGKCIEVARPYYEAQEKARLAQIECQAAAVQFQRANGKAKKKKEYKQNTFTYLFFPIFPKKYINKNM